MTPANGSFRHCTDTTAFGRFCPVATVRYCTRALLQRERCSVMPIAIGGDWLRGLLAPCDLFRLRKRCSGAVRPAFGSVFFPGACLPFQAREEGPEPDAGPSPGLTADLSRDAGEVADQALGSVTPFWPWYLPPRSL
jgi:hypothetical protein